MQNSDWAEVWACCSLGPEEARAEQFGSCRRSSLQPSTCVGAGSRLGRGSCEKLPLTDQVVDQGKAPTQWGNEPHEASY